MSEEFIINPDQSEKVSENPEKKSEVKDENSSEINGKRITRRRLKPRIAEPNHPMIDRHSQQNKHGSLKKNELTEVLSNLYNDESENSNLNEISMKKNGAFPKFATLLSIGVFIAAVIWAGFFFVSTKNSGNDTNQLNLSINGPTELSLGATTTYIISYKNNSNVLLKKAVLNAYFPEGFVFLNSSMPASNPGHNEWALGTISPYQKGTVNITGLNYGSLNEQKSWRVFLNYLPTNFNSELQKATTLTTVITAAPVKLTISGPDQVSVGIDVTYTFNIQKNQGWKGNMIIVPEVPSNFTITSSSPRFDKNNQWLIPMSTSTNNHTAATYSITGNYTGSGGVPAPIKGTILMPGTNGQHYQIGLAQLTSTIIKNDVSVNLAINSSAVDFNSRPGDTLNMTIRVKNQSAKQISNVVVKLLMTAPADRKVSMLDWSALVDKNNNTIVGEQIDDFTRRGIISWNSAQMPALAILKPNGEVTIDLQLPVKGAKKFDLSAVKSPLITAAVEVKFKDAAKTTQSVGTHPIGLTLNSDLTFSSDDTVANAGNPGEKHTVNWVINNTFHALKNIKITATVFGDTTFSPITKAAGEVTYDSTQNTITWSIPEMPTETDVLNSSFSLVLNKTNPSQNLLLSKAHLTAVDSVTEKIIDLATEEISLGQ